METDVVERSTTLYRSTHKYINNNNHNNIIIYRTLLTATSY